MKATKEESLTPDTGEKKGSGWFRKASLRKFLAYIAIRIVFLIIETLLKKTN